MKFELKRVRNQPVADAELLADMQRVAGELKQDFLTMDQYNTLSKYNSSTIKRRFHGWLPACKKAGLATSATQDVARIPEDELFTNLEAVWIHLGRQPRQSDMIAPVSRYGHSVYKRRFGSWIKALTIFVSRVNKEETENAQSREASPFNKHKTSRDVNWRLRFLVMRRDNFKCTRCGRSPAKNPDVILHVDHKEAWANGGETIMDNLQTLCSVCNIGKSNLE